ncbi:glutamyl-tRNA reductase-binding protein, chloroplastic-like [Telopea speciosissima]|uniref:glutamyl-tRNA reductase-binding protein, chloroplastic-like n=1 Tax=Telopea speciosissima TaxID=54955 RepID=UPI001CC488D5|nr:glutamyl-tRNA reductase-binding protein, chloroplastic-like [Telopea speciosissima]
MVPHAQCLTPRSCFPAPCFCRTISLSAAFPATQQIKRTHLSLTKKNPDVSFSFQPVRCSVSVLSEPTLKELLKKPSPAEISRTIMELSSVGSLCTPTQQGLPLCIGVRFAVDPEGMPILCLNAEDSQFTVGSGYCLNVLLEQCGARISQCSLQGSLTKPEDKLVLKKLQSTWKKRFEEEVDDDLMYVVAVERVLQMQNFMEAGEWVTLMEYKNAIPDPLRNFAEKIVNEFNTNFVEEILRFCNIYVDLEFQVMEAKLIWVDRLGFDVHLLSPEGDTFEVRVPFPREVTDEKSTKSSFNCMSQFAWEVEKNYSTPMFEKVKHLKQISCSRHK